MNPLYIVAGFIFVGIVIIFVVYYGKTMKMTSYINGAIVKADERVVRDQQERREETVLVCKYSIRGKDYEIIHVMRGLRADAYPPGKSIIVWYNPNVPEMARIKNA
ncbi:MAG TPA: DUF3592 domain-containing protein [Tepidisphaeraceae bacterium]|jgi:hypothetical protein|nr:DUF3592 domain-containing protein [Tepidisphaeraceae bacterium]